MFYKKKLNIKKKNRRNSFSKSLIKIPYSAGV